jgi:putative Holliday junction resolvase
MIVRNPADLKPMLKPGQALLGLDLGTKTIGLARCDRSLMFAAPLETIRRAKFTKDAEELIAIIEREEIGGLVLGLPFNMDGTEGPRCQSTRQFATNLLSKIDIPIAFWDERMSTQAVTRTLLENDTTRKRRAELVDKMAAAYILQGALDAIASASAQDAAQKSYMP